jgi:endoglucanase
MKKLFLFLAVVLPMLNSFASDIVEAVPLTNRIILVHFDDGKVKQHTAGESIFSGVLTDNPLNLVNAMNKMNYQFQSFEDANYANAKNPDSLGRKTKATEFSLPSFFPTTKNYAFEHWVYLFLPKPMVNGKKYRLTTGSLASNTNTFIIEFNDWQKRSEAVHVNLIGYTPLAAKKYGYIYYWLGDKNGLKLESYAKKPDNSPVPFYLLRNNNNTIAFTGNIIFRKGIVKESMQTDVGISGSNIGAEVYECEFSSFNTPGTYRLVVPGIGCSFPFEIKKDIYREVYKKVAKGVYQQRSGITLPASRVGVVRPTPHRPLVTPNFKNKLVYTSWRHRDGTKLENDAADLPALLAGVKGPLNNVWGWYQDAGDWDSYYSHVRVPNTIMNTYEVAPRNFARSELNIPESGNTLPDILDEARWQIRYMFRLRKEAQLAGFSTGGVGGARVFADLSGGDAPNGIAIRSWQDTTRTWYITGEDPWMTYRYAGLAAQFAFILQKNGFTDPEGINWQSEAISAYNWASANTKVGDETSKFDDYYLLRNDRGYAAAALYRLTKLAVYNTRAIADLAWLLLPNPDNLLHFPNKDKQWAIFMYAMAGTEGGISVDAPTFNACKESISFTTYWHFNAGNDFFQVDRALRWYGNVFDPLGGGNATIPRMFEAIIGVGLGKRLGFPAADLALYREKLYTGADYFMGTNAMNTTWITGLGERSPNQDIFSLDGWYNGTNKMSEGLIPYGAIGIGGAGTSVDPNPFNPDYAWNGDNAGGAVSKIYPTDINQWPGHERYFEQRWCPNVNEYTIHEILVPAMVYYGFLCDTAQVASTREAVQEVTLNGEIDEKNANVLKWENLDQEIDVYELEKSTDGIKFQTIVTQRSTENDEFKFVDKNVSSDLFYRLKYATISEETKFSNVVKLSKNSEQPIVFYPQPATDLINISVNLNEPEYINFVAVDIAGRSIWKEGKNLQKGLNTLSIPTSAWKNGTYIFNIASKEGLLNYNQKVMISR